MIRLTCILLNNMKTFKLLSLFIYIMYTGIDIIYMYIMDSSFYDSSTELYYTYCKHAIENGNEESVTFLGIC